MATTPFTIASLAFRYLLAAPPEDVARHAELMRLLQARVPESIALLGDLGRVGVVDGSVVRAAAEKIVQAMANDDDLAARLRMLVGALRYGDGVVDRSEALRGIVGQRVQEALATGRPASLLQADAAIDADFLAKFDADLDVGLMLGWFHWIRYQALPTGQDQPSLYRAVFYFRACFASLVPDENLPKELLPVLVRETTPLGLEMLNRALAGDDDIDLLVLTALWRRVARHTPASAPDRASILSNLAVAIQLDFQQSHSRAGLDEAVIALREATELTPRDHPLHARQASNLTAALNLRFRQGRDLADLDEAITAGRDAVRATQPDDPDPAQHLGNLAGVLQARFELTRERPDLEEGLEMVRAALRTAPVGHPRHDAYIRGLSEMLGLRSAGEDGNLDDLNAAVDLLQENLATPAVRVQDASERLNALGGALLRRYERGHSAEDLDQAVEMTRRAVGITPLDDRGQGACLANLGHALRMRYGQSGARDDIDESVTVLRAAVEAHAPDPASGAGPLSELAEALQARFEAGGGGAEDLDEAIARHREALRVTPAHDPDRPGYLAALAAALIRRFQWAGPDAALDEGVDLVREALRTGTTSTDRGSRLNTLGLALQNRYRRFGSSADLDEAIECFRRTLQAIPGLDRSKPMYASNLAITLRLRYQRAGREDDLRESVAVFRESLENLSADAPVRGGLLNGLGNTLQLMYQRSGVAADLDAAISAGRQALSGATDDAERSRYLHNLAIGLGIRYERTRDAADLDEAVQTASEAVSRSAQGSTRRATHLRSLGNMLQSRHEAAGLAADREAAVAAFTEVAATGNADPSERVIAGRRAAMLLASTDPSAAVKLVNDAAERLPQVVLRVLERHDQQHLLGEHAGLASDAAAVTLQCGEGPPGERGMRALQLLESGRAVMMAQRLQLRTDLTAELASQHPDIASELMSIAYGLDSSPDFEPGPSPGADAGSMDRRRPLTRRMEELIAEIRTLHGFESFASLPGAEALTRAAGEGPVVTFNVSLLRRDALILTPGGVTTVELPRLDVQSLVEHLVDFRHAIVDVTETRAEARAAREVIRKTLAWLWDVAVEPVLKVLGYTGPASDDQRLPRVWWAPGGFLSLFPLHAAGHHTVLTDPDFRLRTVIDRVISSYTPTIGALIHSRNRAAVPSGTDQAIIVAMPTTPGWPGGGQLTHVADEVRIVRAHLKSATTLTEPGPDDQPPQVPLPTAAQVLQRIGAVSIAHFACHGLSDPADPSRSLLFLHDWEEQPLTVSAISALTLHDARLAYLSACSTAQAHNDRLLDESLHLTAAFQLAGFPHVVGTLWTIDDEVAVEVADTFYRTLRAGASMPLDPARAAYALHTAIREARDRYPAAPSLWACYLHAGA